LKQSAYVFCGPFPKVYVSDSSENAWDFGVIKPNREDVLTPLFEGSSLCALTFERGPQFRNIVLRDEYQCEFSLILIHVAEMRVKILAPKGRLFVTVVENSNPVLRQERGDCFNGGSILSGE
jgi:hypothetical protein